MSDSHGPLPFIEQIARTLKSDNDAENAPDKINREIDDLAAQQDMACWGFWMMFAIFAQAVIGVVGSIALIITIRQGQRALGIGQDSVVATRESTAMNIAKDRAFVFVDDIRVTRAANGTYFAYVVWKNGGVTPTKGFRCYVNINLWEYPVPPQTKWDDTGSGVARALVPPQSILDSGWVPIEPIWVNVARKNNLLQDKNLKHVLLIWGWCEYNDVFPGTPRHRTEFCREVRFSGSEKEPTYWDSSCYRAFPYGKYNNTDDECLKPIQTNPPRDGS